MNIKTFCLTGTLLLLSIGTYAQKADIQQQIAEKMT